LSFSVQAKKISYQLQTMTYPVTSYLGAQQNAMCRHLDNHTPGAVQQDVYENHWSYNAMSQNGRCSLAANGQCQLMSPQNSVGFWNIGAKPSMNTPTDMAFQQSECHGMLMRQEGPSSYATRLADKACPPGCCGRASPENFWTVGEDRTLLDQYNRAQLDFCYNWAQGDDEAMKQCLAGKWKLPTRGP
jgi:hypothetical protein